MKTFAITVLCLAFAATEVLGHGMMLQPCNRASRWRTNSSAPVDYDDDQFYCGGFGTQYDINHGKCGPCGDAYNDPRPRPNENGGTYGQGVIMGKYVSGGEMDVVIDLTTNHHGYFTWHICDLDNSQEVDSCFEKHPVYLMDGSQRYYPTPHTTGNFNIKLRVPEMTCNHCSLQWNYRAGNSWGTCKDGHGAMGCGNQEHFRSCADIAILPADKVESAP